MNVFDFVMEMEQQARGFYRQLASQAEAIGVQRIFNMLASDEERLMEKFAKMKQSSSAVQMLDVHASTALAEAQTTIFLLPELAKISDDAAAYEYVISIEQALCSLYEQVADVESETSVKELLSKIALEERRELDSIRGLADFIDAPNRFLAWGEFSNLGEFYNFGRDNG